MSDITDVIRKAWAESPLRVIAAVVLTPFVLAYLYVLLVVVLVMGGAS